MIKTLHTCAWYIFFTIFIFFNINLASMLILYLQLLYVAACYKSSFSLLFSIWLSSTIFWHHTIPCSCLLNISNFVSSYESCDILWFLFRFYTLWIWLLILWIIIENIRVFFECLIKRLSFLSSILYLVLVNQLLNWFLLWDLFWWKAWITKYGSFSSCSWLSRLLLLVRF